MATPYTPLLDAHGQASPDSGQSEHDADDKDGLPEATSRDRYSGSSATEAAAAAAAVATSRPVGEVIDSDTPGTGAGAGTAPSPKKHNKQKDLVFYDHGTTQEKKTHSTKTPKTPTRRRGPGRPPGSRNRATIARMKAEQEAIELFRKSNPDMPSYTLHSAPGDAPTTVSGKEHSEQPLAVYTSTPATYSNPNAHHVPNQPPKSSIDAHWSKYPEWDPPPAEQQQLSQQYRHSHPPALTNEHYSQL